MWFDQLKIFKQQRVEWQELWQSQKFKSNVYFSLTAAAALRTAEGALNCKTVGFFSSVVGRMREAEAGVDLADEDGASFDGGRAGVAGKWDSLRVAAA